tara:strand:+ start:9136 stop:9753 length:618 start_codon:yes stop_codon:yes gene_type:complete
MWYSETLGTIRTPRAITVDGVQHPANIFRAWSKPELLAIGIAPARVETPDSRYYNTGAESYTFTDGEWVISYATTEKDVADLKKALIEKIKANVGALLAPSDWRVIRAQDSGTPMSEPWTTYRNEVRAHGNSLESGIEAFASVDAVKAFQNYEVQEERKVSTYDDAGVETIGPEIETVTRTVDKTYWNWPTAPDAVADPYHVRYI